MKINQLKKINWSGKIRIFIGIPWIDLLQIAEHPDKLDIFNYCKFYIQYKIIVIFLSFAWN